MSGASGIFSSLGRLFNSPLDPEKLRSSAIGFSQGGDEGLGIGDIAKGLLGPPIDPQRAAGTSILEAAGAGRPPAFLKDELDRAIETGAVEPLSSLPTEVQGVPVKGRERLMEVFDKIKPILGSPPKTAMDVFKVIPKLPANVPDLSLPDPNPPGFAGIELEDFLERVRRKHGVGI